MLSLLTQGPQTYDDKISRPSLNPPIVSSHGCVTYLRDVYGRTEGGMLAACVRWDACTPPPPEYYVQHLCRPRWRLWPVAAGHASASRHLQR